MVVVDTNVLSELLRPRPAPTVLRWFDTMASPELATTAITAAELLHGVARLPPGRRQAQLAAGVVTLLAEDLAGRVLPFDERAAEAYALVLRTRETLGRPVGALDAQIAAICVARDARLCTRNGRDFEGIGLGLVDPWDEAR